MDARPADWGSLPDIPLYMDQVVGYLSRQTAAFGEGDGLTPAMINNYLKDGLLEREGRLALLRLVHDLPEPQREVVYLRVFGGLSFQEIGDVLGRTENWARVTFYRSKEKLRNGGAGNEK